MFQNYNINVNKIYKGWNMVLRISNLTEKFYNLYDVVMVAIKLLNSEKKSWLANASLDLNKNIKKLDHH